MAKDVVVVFHEYKAEILVNPDISALVTGSYLVNPDLSQVTDLPPHRWVREGDSVIPAPEAVVEAREAIIATLKPPTREKPVEVAPEAPISVIEVISGPTHTPFYKTQAFAHFVTFIVTILVSYVINRV